MSKEAARWRLSEALGELALLLLLLQCAPFAVSRLGFNF